MNQFLRVLYSLFKWMPFGVVRFLGRLIGVIVWLVNGRAVRVARKNISMCMPQLSENQQKVLLRNSSIEMTVTGLELFKIWSTESESVLTRLIEVRNEDYYLDAVADDKPVIIAVPHLGNWEVVGLYCAKHTQTTTMYAPIKHEIVDTLVKRSREASGSHLVPTNVRGVMAMLKALKRGEQVGILPDQQALEGFGAFSPFFGVPAYTVTLMNTLQRKSAAIVVMAFAERIRGGWRLHFMAPETEVYSSDLQTSVDAMNRSIENCVRQCPAQYQWEYKRFRRQETGSNPYSDLK